MKYLLPHFFKISGLIISVISLIIWCLIQRYTIRIDNESLRKIFLLISFTAFILGFFISIFSKEKKEDEYIMQKRLETLLFAAIIQVIILVAGVYAIGFNVIESKENQMLFFISCILIFYVIYIARFNYLLHFPKMLNNEKQTERD